MKHTSTEIIKNTLQKISDIVTPTMGPKGRLAVISDEFSRPYLTDDGVTVAKECLNFDNEFERMIAISAVEASSNTEKSAFDGTTLTVLLLNELYKDGLRLIESGDHPQTAADKIKKATEDLLKDLKNHRIEVTDKNSEHLIKSVSYITTKIPAVGELVYQAFLHAGNSMNVITEFDREHEESSIEYVDGMVIDSGYFTQEFEKFTDKNREWNRQNAKLFFLAEGALTVNGLKRLIGSIDRKQPLVFFVGQNFNQDTLQGLLDNLIANQFDFIFVFINDPKPDEVFLDLAAKTNGLVQSVTHGTTDYEYSFAGTAKSIKVERNKTTIVASGDKEEIQKRLDKYKDELSKNKYTTNYIRADTLMRRMANLDKGVTKIKIAAASVTEFRTIKFKLDDAIGAVRCAMNQGVVLGGGKTLYVLSKEYPLIKQSLETPLKTILSNAGIDLPNENVLFDKRIGLDAKTGLEVDLLDAGIVDSYASIESAIKNASSIACSYLRAYILINKNIKEGN